MSAPWPLTGALEFEGEVPVFRFRAQRVSEVQALLKDMVAEVDVRFDAQGSLAYHLGIPDRGLPASTIPLPAEQVRRIERGAARMAVCPTYIEDAEGGRLDLSRFVMDVAHDWSGVYAQAWKAFAEGRLDEAAGLLRLGAAGEVAPIAAARLLGRCLREMGKLDAAATQYRAALRLGHAAHRDELLPAAAGVLNDLGVAHKRSGDAVRAEIALLHALHLRPNYPQALLTLAATTLDPHLVLHACARVIRIGRHGAMVDALLASVAEETASDAADWRMRAEASAETVDLSRWPLERRGLGTLSVVERDLDRAEMSVGPTPQDVFGDLPVQPPRVSRRSAR